MASSIFPFAQVRVPSPDKTKDYGVAIDALHPLRHVSRTELIHKRDELRLATAPHDDDETAAKMYDLTLDENVRNATVGELDAAMQKISFTDQKLSIEIQGLRDRTADAEQNLGDVQSRLDQCQTQCDGLSDENSNLRAELAGLRAEHEKLRAHASQTAGLIHENQTLQAVREENETLHKQLEEQRSLVRRKWTERRKLDEELDDLADERDNIQAERDELALKMPSREVMDHIKTNLRRLIELRRINRYNEEIKAGLVALCRKINMDFSEVFRTAEAKRLERIRWDEEVMREAKAREAAEAEAAAAAREHSEPL